jgi:hypothetical protein
MSIDKKKLLIQFIQALISDAAENNEPYTLTEIHIIKYIYLLDYYMAQANKGQPFTDFIWIFYSFGPFSYDLDTFIKELAFTGELKSEDVETRYEDNKIIKRYVFDPSYAQRKDIWKYFPITVMVRIFQKDLQRFKNNTSSLLDYVYFYTEPMHGIKPGNRISFAKVKQMTDFPKPIELRPLTMNQIKRFKQAAKSLKSKPKLVPIVISDDKFFSLQEQIDNATKWDIEGNPGGIIKIG